MRPIRVAPDGGVYVAVREADALREVYVLRAVERRRHRVAEAVAEWIANPPPRPGFGRDRA